MPKKIQIKTKKNSASVAEFINSIADERLKKDSKLLLRVFKKATGKTPKMWGPSIIGFGEYTYYRSNGDEGTSPATGFSPRKSGPTLYIMAGYKKYGDLLDKLGKHKVSKSCLYLKTVEGIDLAVLDKLIKKGLADLKKVSAVR